MIFPIVGIEDSLCIPKVETVITVVIPMDMTATHPGGQDQVIMIIDRSPIARSKSHEIHGS
jgi:hypothetical protein